MLHSTTILRPYTRNTRVNTNSKTRLVRMEMQTASRRLVRVVQMVRLQVDIGNGLIGGVS